MSHTFLNVRLLSQTELLSSVAIKLWHQTISILHVGSWIIVNNCFCFTDCCNFKPRNVLLSTFTEHKDVDILHSAYTSNVTSLELHCITRVDYKKSTIAGRWEPLVQVNKGRAPSGPGEIWQGETCLEILAKNMLSVTLGQIVDSICGNTKESQKGDKFYNTIIILLSHTH